MRAWRRWLTTRRSLRTLERLAVAVERQNTLLERLVEQFAPVRAAVPVARSEASVDYFDPDEARVIEAYRQRVHASTGHLITEDEALAYLAEVKSAAQWLGATPPERER